MFFVTTKMTLRGPQFTTHFTTTSPRFYQHKNRGNRDIPNQNATSTTEKFFLQKP
jgi:hypothetical protein